MFAALKAGRSSASRFPDCPTDHGPDSVTASDPESQIAAWLAKYAPAIEAQLKDARLRLRAYLTRGHELVFDNYNALVFGISPTERTSDAFISIAGYSTWITLFFLHGRYGAE